MFFENPNTIQGIAIVAGLEFVSIFRGSLS